MSNTTCRKSVSQRGHLVICVTEYTDGEIIMTAVDRRAMILEDIALSEYIDASKVVYSFEHGWMIDGREIPYLDPL